MESLQVELDDGYTVVRMQAYESLHREDLFPWLGRSHTDWPWLLGRLAALLPLKSVYPPGEVQIMDDPLVVVDLLLSEPEGGVVAKLQLQFGPPGGAILGTVLPSRSSDALASLRVWLMEEPEELRPFQVSVQTPAGVEVLTTP